MAPKRPPPPEEPPPASSSGEEEVSSAEEEEEEKGEEAESSSSEEEETGGTHKPSSTPPPQPKKPDSEGSESESDSKRDNARVKPTRSMEDASPVSKKPRSKHATASKRAGRVGQEPKESKRAKKKDTDGAPVEKSSEDTKRQLVRRLWGEDEEITILKGMSDFAEKRGVSPSSDMEAFHEFIKKSLQIEASRSQLVEKIRRLKKKFENNEGKGKQGEDRTFSKPHDQKAFDLSKKIWGKEGINAAGAESASKTNGKSVKKGPRASKSLVELKREVLSSPKAVKEAKKADGEKQSSGGGGGGGELVRIDRSVSGGGLEAFVLDKGLELVDGAKKAEVEKKWRSFHVAELELFVRRVELIREQAKLVLGAYKAAEN